MCRQVKLWIIVSVSISYLCSGLWGFTQPPDKRSSTHVIHRWRVRNTAHFQIMYREKYIDAEEVYRNLNQELNLELRCSAPKTKVFIRQGHAYVDLSKRKIVVANEAQLRHELTHLLFYQLCPSVPLALQEGIACYKEHNDYPENLVVEFTDFLSLCSTRNSNLEFGNLERRKLYLIFASWVGRLVEEYGIEKFKQFYKLCTHPSKIRLAYDRVYEK